MGLGEDPPTSPENQLLSDYKPDQASLRSVPGQQGCGHNLRLQRVTGQGSGQRAGDNDGDVVMLFANGAELAHTSDYAIDNVG